MNWSDLRAFLAVSQLGSLRRAAQILRVTQPTVARRRLPSFIGNGAPGLVRLSAPIEALQADYWSVTHPDLSRNPSVRAVMDWIITCFRTLAH